MKFLNIKTSLVFILSITLIISCKKSEYFTDGGTHNPVTPLSNYDYLKQHSWQSFDTLIVIIDHYNLKDEINKAATFFAPTDYSINRYLKLKDDSVKMVNENNKYTLENMYKDISADSIRQYLFSEKITLQDASTVATPFTSLGKTSCAMLKFLQSGYNQWGSALAYSLYYIKVRGSLDDPNNPPPANDPTVDARVLCQTTGIQTSSGSTLLHVLSNTHIFVRF